MERSRRESEKRRKIYNAFSLFTVITFYKVSANAEFTNTEPLFLGETEG